MAAHRRRSDDSVMQRWTPLVERPAAQFLGTGGERTDVTAHVCGFFVMLWGTGLGSWVIVRSPPIHTVGLRSCNHLLVLGMDAINLNRNATAYIRVRDISGPSYLGVADCTIRGFWPGTERDKETGNKLSAKSIGNDLSPLRSSDNGCR